METKWDKFYDKLASVQNAASAVSKYQSTFVQVENNLSKWNELSSKLSVIDKGSYQLSTTINNPVFPEVFSTTYEQLTLINDNLSQVNTIIQDACVPLEILSSSNGIGNSSAMSYFERKNELFKLDTKISELNESINKVQHYIDNGFYDVDHEVPMTFYEEWGKMSKSLVDAVCEDVDEDKCVADIDRALLESIESIWSKIDLKEILSEVVLLLGERKEEFITIRERIEKAFIRSIKLDIRREIRKFRQFLFRNNQDEEDILASNSVKTNFRTKIFFNNDNETIHSIYRFSFS